jgi:hypothetical protein
MAVRSCRNPTAAVRCSAARSVPSRYLETTFRLLLLNSRKPNPASSIMAAASNGLIWSRPQGWYTARTGGEGGVVAAQHGEHGVPQHRREPGRSEWRQAQPGTRVLHARAQHQLVGEHRQPNHYTRATRACGGGCQCRFCLSPPPSELVASPSELSASPSELLASPSELLASPSELLASPSELTASPSELSPCKSPFKRSEMWAPVDSVLLPSQARSTTASHQPWRARGHVRLQKNMSARLTSPRRSCSCRWVGGGV